MVQLAIPSGVPSRRMHGQARLLQRSWYHRPSADPVALHLAYP